MPTIEISVTDKIAVLNSDSSIVCGNSDYEIEFDFDAEWDDYPTKTARFAYIKKGKRMYKDVLFEEDTVAVPPLYGINDVAVGVYAGSIHTTTPALIPCRSCITDGEPVHDPPTPDVYDQLMAYLAAIQAGTVNSGNLVADMRGTIAPVAGVVEEVS